MSLKFMQTKNHDSEREFRSHQRPEALTGTLFPLSMNTVSKLANTQAITVSSERLVPQVLPDGPLHNPALTTHGMPTLAKGTPTSTAPSELAPGTFPSFDQNLHLDSIASAATEAAATQFQDVPLFSSPASSAPTSLNSSFSYGSSTQSIPYLSMMSQAPTNSSPFDRPNGTEQCSDATPALALQAKLQSFPTSLTTGVEAPLTFSSDAACLVPEGTPNEGVEFEPHLTSAPGSPSTLKDEASQQKAIEDAVRSLNAHHKMAQNAALRHHEQTMGLVPAPNEAMSLAHRDASPPPASPCTKHKQEPLQGGSKRARLDTANSSSPTQHSSPTSEYLYGAPPLEHAQKRFQCSKCPRAFARAYNLNTHLSTHDPDPTRAKPFPCPYRSCKFEGGRSFSRKHDLQRHVASVHEHEPEPGINENTGEVEEGTQAGGLASLGLGTPGKKFHCSQCTRAFVRRDALHRHQCVKTEHAKELLNDEKSKLVDAPTKAAAPYVVRGFPDQVIQQVALKLMAETEVNAQCGSMLQENHTQDGQGNPSRDMPLSLGAHCI
ncbi:hypothetical protein MVES_001059 [Malassezia vespertilionis]|uniref:C2H2-type domain-containing protein n=1 Tax=Malassezia vespertilionis TaxID=2020962 RepID=A0A2N1JE67_9BASI|nr:hypothetical protein MVES_001059 [Malassezia vespertilionis]